MHVPHLWVMETGRRTGQGCVARSLAGTHDSAGQQVSRTRSTPCLDRFPPACS